MKGKLTVLGLLATVVTVGGVYATWSFAEKDAAAANTDVSVSMTGVNSSTEKGTLSVMVKNTGGYTLAVDDANGDHYADLLATGEVTVTFKPSADASADVLTDGIDVQCVISYAAKDAASGPATIEDWTYDSKQIFEIVNDEDAPIILLRDDATYDQTTGMFTWKIAAEDVGIQLKNEFFIDTLDKYNEMKTELSKGNFLLTVSEYSAELQ